MYLGVGSLV